MGRQASHAAQVGAVARTTFVLLVLVSSLGAACATTRTTAGKSPNVPRPFPGAPLPPIPDTPVPDAAAVPPALVETLPAVVTTALTLRGMPYRNGGSQPADGFDCSGLVQWVFAQHGTPLPRDVRQQFDVGEKIGPNQLLPGDLVFFQTVSRGASHVGIAIGRDEFVHAPSSRGVVRVERLSNTYWSKRWVGARRVASSAASPAD
jgi:cell wall-associated NlpC family hydrolase